MTSRNDRRNPTDRPGERDRHPDGYEGGIGRRGYVNDPLEGASGTTQGDATQEGTPETRQQSDPAADRSE